MDKKFLDKKKGAGNSISIPFKQEGGMQITIQGKKIAMGKSGCVDLVFVFDTTGSMSGKIQALLATCGNLVEDMTKKQLDYRVALVSFGDLTVSGDKIIIEGNGYTNKLDIFKQMLKNIRRNSGGGNLGESSLEAIDKALQLKPRSNAVRVFILITDEPVLNSHRVSQIIAFLCNQEIMTFCVTPNLGYFKEMAEKTGGVWLEVGPNTNFEAIKNALLKLSQKVAQIVADVHNPVMGGGSVKRYLAAKGS